MSRIALEDGIHTILATPHTLNGVYVNPIHEVIERATALQNALSKNQLDLKICVGADVHLCLNMMKRVETGEAGTINNAFRYILLEFPSQSVPLGVKDEIFSLKLNGITPIISHPERNPIIQHDLNTVYELVRMGALCQITAMSITGEFGEIAEDCAGTLLRNRLVHVIASDAHSSRQRPPILSHAVETAAQILESYEEAEHMVTEVPSVILSGGVVEVPEPMPIHAGVG